MQISTWILLSPLLLLAWALTHTRIPNLLSAGLALAAFTAAVLAALPPLIRRRSWGAAGLLMLGLPIGPTADFYLGYPLRTLAATITDWALGPGVWREGNGLTDGTALLYVDAPCSGLRMLTIGVAMACLLGAFLRLTPWRFVAVVTTALGLTLFGNAARAMLLFLLERQGLLSSTTDTVTGLLIFSTCALLLVGLALRLSADNSPPALVQRQPLGFLRRFAAALWVLSLLVGLGASAGVGPVGPGGQVGPGGGEQVPAWPTHWESRRLIPVAFDADTARFLQSFPGAMAEFQVEGTHTRVLLRMTGEATRRMHPAEHCYTATGWECTPSSTLEQDAYGLWNAFTAERGDTVQEIRQCYFQLREKNSENDLSEWLQGRPNWPDASSWWWAAAKSGEHPYLAMTISTTP